MVNALKECLSAFACSLPLGSLGLFCLMLSDPGMGGDAPTNDPKGQGSLRGAGY